MGNKGNHTLNLIPKIHYRTAHIRAKFGAFYMSISKDRAVFIPNFKIADDFQNVNITS